MKAKMGHSVTVAEFHKVVMGRRHYGRTALEHLRTGNGFPNSVLQSGYVQEKKFKLLERGYIILERISNPNNSTLYSWSTLSFNVPQSIIDCGMIPSEPQERFYHANHASLDGDSSLYRRRASIWYLSDHVDHKRYIAQFSTPREFSFKAVVGYLNRFQDRIQKSHYRPFMYTYLDHIALLMCLHTFTVN